MNSLTLENNQQNDVNFSSNDRENFLTNGEEVLYDLLFADENPKNKHARGETTFNQQHQQQRLDESFSYLQELNSYHVDRLQAEPIVLLDSQQHIQEEIKNLAFSNYKTFIRTAVVSKEIYSDFSVIESKLDHLVTHLPEFGGLCENFTKNIQTISGSRRTNNLTLQKHNQLLEILEISQLMDTCVRNEYYEEALDLAAYVKRLDKRFSSSIQLVRQIVNDVNKSLNIMLKQLLQQLKTNLQFNQCLKIIGIIRRLEVFSESELRIKFLQLRDSWLNTLLKQIPTNDPYHHISKTIEEMRIHLFDIITQYRAIFSDDDLNSASITTQSSASNLLLFSKDLNNESKLFYCWLQQKIKTFLHILDNDLRLGVGARLDSVLSQSMYFGLAFSRVGLDFRVLIVPIFEEVILEHMSKSFAIANVKFEESLGKVNWSELYLENSKTSNSSLLTSAFDETTKHTASATSIINPPIQLLDFQPLAIYLNSILVAFNEFRLCGPLNLFGKVHKLVWDSLVKMSSHLSVYYKREKASFDKNEHELFLNFLYHLAHVLVPFMEKCLSCLFSYDQLQRVLNFSQSDLDKLKNAHKFNVKLLIPELYDLIPVKKSEEATILPVEAIDLKVEDANNAEIGSQDLIENEKDLVVESNLVALEANENSDDLKKDENDQFGQ
jgi:conserved oligomeric Golgi complex subunit 8